jgi:diguanylate cyclase (GGDEF)-like protein
MQRIRAPESEEDLSSRDRRLKLVLLSVALILVAVYAVSVTRMGEYLLAQVSAILHSRMLPVGVAVLILAGIAVIAGRLIGKRVQRIPDAEALAFAGTSVLNGRKGFVGALAAELERKIQPGKHLAVHVIDLDRFRALNETLGEAEGDRLLKLVGDRLLIQVDRSGCVARIGDDEYAVIQRDVSGARHAEIFARGLIDACKDAANQVVQRQGRISASIGIALAPDHGDDPLTLLGNASLALRAAKAEGGNALRIFGREMKMAVDRRVQMQRAISDGLHNGWFHLHFQPQYDLSTRRLTGFEALARLLHPELGDIPPTAFVPAAEECGLIQPLGEWIIRQALMTASAWPPYVTLSINVSPVQFRNGDVAGAILTALESSGFDARRLRIEVPEAVLLETSKAVDDQLTRLKCRGVSIVLDDFGLGRSRLAMLSKAACDAVKLDRTLVERVGEVPEMDVLVKSLIGTAQSFHLDVLAEGVEKAEQARFLVSHECENVQGFLFGHPVPAAELGAIIAKDARNRLPQERARRSSSAAA